MSAVQFPTAVTIPVLLMYSVFSCVVVLNPSDAMFVDEFTAFIFVVSLYLWSVASSLLFIAAVSLYLWSFIPMYMLFSWLVVL